jgi:16S rRNA (adenine1518-N6/adenine1519-N6)-dimethyltransferase
MEKIKNISEFANKRFGQNFLKNKQIIKKIIKAIPKPSLKVVEIGSGLGDLTKELINVRNVTAFEVDKRLCKHLKDRFNSAIFKQLLTLNCDDVLKHWGKRELLKEEYHLVANLPYYIATNIILKALKDRNCQSILVMVQKEVAVKFSAKVGERAFSALTVLTQSVSSAKLLFDVGAENFVPPPKVSSSILLIEKDRSDDNIEFENFLKVAFKQPRKKLSKNLSTQYPKNKIEALFSQLQISLNIRPHETETSIYHHLYNELNKDSIDGREKSSNNRATKSGKRPPGQTKKVKKST